MAVTFKIERNPDPCSECELECAPVKTRPRKGARFLVVSKHPTEMQVHNNKNLSRNALRVFAHHMEKQGFGAENFSFHCGIQCHHDPDLFSRHERTHVYHMCREFFLRAVEKLKPDVIICLGADAARQVYGRDIKITKERGHIQPLTITLTPQEQHHCYVLPLLDPANVSVYPQQDKLIDIDCKALRRFVDAGYNLQKVQAQALGDYIEVEDLQFVIDSEPDILSFDVETTGLDPYAPDAALVSLQICTRAGEAYFLGWDHPQATKSRRAKARLRKQLKMLFARKKTQIIGHNLRFDLSYMYQMLGIEGRISHDTLIMYSMLDEDSHNKDLATCTKLFVPEMAGYSDYFDHTYDKGRMMDVPIVDLVDYACGDTDATYRLFNVLHDKLREDRGIYRSYRNVTIPGANAFQAIEQRGMMIDEKALDRFEAEVEAQVDLDHEDLLRQVPRSIKEIHLKKGLKWTRAAFMRDVLFDHPDGFRLVPQVFTPKTKKLSPELQVPSTSSKDHLPYFFDTCPFVVQLAEHVKNVRLLGTNVRRFRENYVHADGRIYPQYLFHVTVTGRVASRAPNAQNFPARGKLAKAYKRIFIVEDGYCILGADFSQAELRIAADMANERTMLHAFRRNEDVHALTARAVMGIELGAWQALENSVRDFKRFSAKAINFGYLFGMWWKKFKAYAKTQYGVDYTDDDARIAREVFFETYFDLEAWHSKMRRIAHDDKQVRAYCGRVRHLTNVNSSDEGVAKEAERQAINAPVQGTASQIAVRAIVDFDREMRRRQLDIKTIGFVHDAIYVRVPLDLIEFGAKALKNSMENVDLPRWFKRKLKVPMVADVAFGLNMGGLTDMKTLTLEDRYDFSQHEVNFIVPEQIPERDIL